MTASLPPVAVGVPWWGRLSATLAPVLLIGGWTWAAALQPAGFDSVTGTISELAGLDAQSRWVMTAAIAGTGLCHAVTALALRPAAVVGQQPFGGARASGTNDKAGAPQNLLRWTSTRSIKETFVPPTSHAYPYQG